MAIITTTEQRLNDVKALAGRRTALELRDRAIERPDDSATLLAIAAGLERLGYQSVTDLTDDEIDQVLAAL